MSVLTAGLVTVLCGYAAVLAGYLARLSSAVREVEEQSRAGAYNAARVRRILRGTAGAAGTITLSQLAGLALLSAQRLPPSAWVVWGVGMVLSFLAMVLIDAARQRLVRAGK